MSNVLSRGSDVLKGIPHFRLVGREQELVELTSILMKMKKRNLIITGRGGVGVSSIVLGIQASKSDLRTPVDIVGKRFFWLNSDRVFETGNPGTISELFERVRQTLTKTSNAVVVIEDIVDFLRASQACGCSYLINGLMGDLKVGRYQAILETSDEVLGELLRCDGDLLEFCSLYEVREPSSEKLRIILRETRDGLERHHGIAVSDAALETAALLTEKYRLPELRAQPDAAVSLLDQALTDFCREAHASPPGLVAIEKRRQEISEALEKAHFGSGEVSDHRTRLETELGDLDRQRLEVQRAWEERQRDIRALYKDMSDGEEEIRRLEDAIGNLRAEQLERARSLAGNPSVGQEEVTRGSAEGGILELMSRSPMDTAQIIQLRDRLGKVEKLVAEAATRYKERASEIYSGLSISEGEVLRSFSAMSGIPVEKLSENEKHRLKELGAVLQSRVVGQPEPTCEVAKAVQRARLGLKLPNRPSGAFMFLGPSGVGKTELAKALADALGVPLLRFDMSEYMEKHAVAKLIGAPPGYEGYEHGGILTNAVRKNPYSVLLFDEIEKAHPDAFNLMLQLLDDARLTDSRGLTASFRDVVVIMTTNIGTQHFLDEAIDFDAARELALSDLRQTYRPEFLGRFGGCIYCFRRLEGDVLAAIAKRDLGRLQGLIATHNLELEVSDECVERLVRASYVPREGARSVLGFIDRRVTSAIAELLLSNVTGPGIVKVSYDPDGQGVEVLLQPK